MQAFIRAGIGLACCTLLAITVEAQSQPCASAEHVPEGIFAGDTLADPAAPEAWYAYTPQIDGILRASTCGAGFDTTLSVWDGCPNAGGAQLTFNDDACGQQSMLETSVRGGATYYIRVAGYGDERGLFDIMIDVQPGDEEGGIAAGPDVVYTDCQGITNWGVVGTIQAYSLGSYTCNIGNQNLRWGGSWQGTPTLAMNMYRIHEGRLMQIGQSFGKQACCAAAANLCGLNCNGQGGSMLGAGCRDPYSASYNGGHSRLVRRSQVNPWTGAHTLADGTGGNAIWKRLQVERADLNPAQNPGALYFIEGVYVGSDDATNGNANNNASYKRVTVTAGTYDLAMQGAMQTYVPAIRAWRANGLGVGIVDTRVTDSIVDVPSEGRFHVATKVTDLGGGNYRYDYAIFNLTSDRSGGSLSIPVPDGVTVSNIGFHDVNYHSNEIYSNTDWVVANGGGAVTWSSPQTFAQNANSNALRWGTMYNFWFEANAGPTNGSATLGLFKPHTPQSVSFSAPVPTAPPAATGDLNCDGSVNNFDIDPFVLALTDLPAYNAAHPGCDAMNGDVNEDGVLNNFDIDPFVDLLTQG